MDPIQVENIMITAIRYHGFDFLIEFRNDLFRIAYIFSQCEMKSFQDHGFVTNGKKSSYVGKLSLKKILDQKRFNQDIIELACEQVIKILLIAVAVYPFNIFMLQRVSIGIITDYPYFLSLQQMQIIHIYRGSLLSYQDQLVVKIGV